MRKLIKASMNPEELSFFEFFMERIGTKDVSKAIKKAIELSHEHLDNDINHVSQPRLEMYLERLKYGQRPYTISSKEWLRQREQEKQPDIKTP